MAQHTQEVDQLPGGLLFDESGRGPKKEKSVAEPCSNKSGGTGQR